MAVCCAWVLIDVAAVAPRREATVPGQLSRRQPSQIAVDATERPSTGPPSYSRRALVFDFIFVNIYVKFPVVSVARMSGEETDRVQRRQLVSFSQTF